MYGYICLFMGRRFECYADSLYAAKQKAIAHFRPAKSKLGQLSVTLAETPSGPVTHIADF